MGLVLPNPSTPLVQPNGQMTREWYRLFATVFGSDADIASVSADVATKLGGTTGTTDNRLLRADGTGGLTVQNSPVTCADNGNLTGLGTLNGNPIFSKATAAEYQSVASGDKALTPSEVWSAAAYTSLTDGATISVDMATGWNFAVSISGNRTIANPSNATPGQSGCFRVIASGGTRTITFQSQYLTTLTLPISIASSNRCYIFYFVDTSTRIIITAAINNPA